METVELLPHLHMFRFEFGQAYLWDDAGSLTLVDAGMPGQGEAVAAALRELGHQPAALRRVVLTHGHGDHTGSAAEVRSWGAQVLAHRLEAPIVRGEQPQRAPVLADWERPVFAEVEKAMPDAPPALLHTPSPVDQELEHGDVLDIGGGARVVHVPGHTDGSIALHLPAHGVLFTGDAVAVHEARLILGVFNTDPAQAADSLRKLAPLGPAILCPGHGDPFREETAAALNALAGGA